MTDSMITPRMKITDLMQRKARGPTSATQAPGVPGGHKFWCSTCNGFRTHAVKLVAPNEAIKSEILRELALQKEGTRLEVRLSRTQETPSLKARLAIVCRSCGKTSVLVYQAGVWMPEVWGGRLDAHVRRRTAELLGQFDKALMAAVTETPPPTDAAVRSLLVSGRPAEPGAVERTKGALVKRFPVLANVADREVDEAVRDARGGVKKMEDNTFPFNQPWGYDRSIHVEYPTAEERWKRHAETLERAILTAPEPMPTEKPRPSARAKAKVVGWTMSVPFLLMGALYVLAWRGTYIWPIYYAIQPWYAPWMNDWWFWSLSWVVPLAVFVAYIAYFRNRADIIDWRPESEAQKKLPAVATSAGFYAAANFHKYSKYAKGTAMERPDWLDKG